MRIYVARPISGSTPEIVFTYYANITQRLREAGYEVLHPMTGKNDLRTEITFRAANNKGPTSTDQAIFGRDMWMVKMADVVFAYLPATKIASIGTCSELIVGKVLGKHTVLALEGEENIHKHGFVLAAADVLFPEVDSAMTYLIRLAKGEF